MHRLARRTGLRSQKGFTAVEMMVAVAIMGITMAVAIPTFRVIAGGSVLVGGAERLAAQFKLARQMAVSQGVPYIVVWDADNSSVDIVRDEDADGEPDDDEPNQGALTLPVQLHLSNPDTLGFDEDYVTLLANGSASESGTLIVGDTRGDTKSVVLLGPTGHVRVD
jgi:prepilin-type N-terminal cleavage/methylation domain-containing protein